MPSPARIVVIGAGIAGLAAGLRLSHMGCAVTVLDRHAAPGGKLRTLPSAAGPVDAGPTVLTLRDVFDTLFAEVGERIEDHLTLHREDILARHFWPDGSTLDLFSDPERSALAIGRLAGRRAADQYRSFAAASARLFQAFDAPMMRAAAPRQAALTAHVMRHPALLPLMAPHKSMAAALADQFTDPRLRQLFGRYATYVGGTPCLSPAILSLVSHAEALGVWRIEGGMHRLARVLAALIVARGGSLRQNIDVQKIVQSNGRVTGVTTADQQHLACDAILFAGDPRALHLGMLGQGIRGAVPRQACEPRSLSAQVWAFAATPSRSDLAHHNVFFGPDPQTEFAPLAQGARPVDPTVYVCAQDRGTGIDPPSIERFETIVNAPPVTAPDSTDESPGPCRTLTFQTLARRGLVFSPDPGNDALTTPRDFARLFPGSQGALYGRSPHGLMAAFQRPTARSPIPGLYLAGGGTHPGAGLPMAALSGAHAAAAIWKDLSSTWTFRPMATPGGMSTA